MYGFISSVCVAQPCRKQYVGGLQHRKGLKRGYGRRQGSVWGGTLDPISCGDVFDNRKANTVVVEWCGCR